MLLFKSLIGCELELMPGLSLIRVFGVELNALQALRRAMAEALHDGEAWKRKM